MRNKWPFVAAASFVNSLVITGAFMEFKLGGVSGMSPSYSAADLHTFFSINPLLFAAGMFVVTIGLMVSIIGISRLVAGVADKLHALNKSLTNPSTMTTSFDTLHKTI